MKGKRVFYAEAAYFAGLLILALGTALMEFADFGMSMVVAPAYIIHLKVSQYLPVFSFGMSEYLFQALLLAVLSIVMKKVKKCYFLSFLTAVLYGIVLDAAMVAAAVLPAPGIMGRLAAYMAGLIICAVGVALLFHTYFAPEAYEMVVKEFSLKFNVEIGKMKTLYDCCSCVFGIVLSVCFFGSFVGVRWGTVVCALINGWMIGRISAVLERKFDFRDAFPLRERLNR